MTGAERGQCRQPIPSLSAPKLHVVRLSFQPWKSRRSVSMANGAFRPRCNFISYFRWCCSFCIKWQEVCCRAELGCDVWMAVSLMVRGVMRAEIGSVPGAQDYGPVGRTVQPTPPSPRSLLWCRYSLIQLCCLSNCSNSWRTGFRTGPDSSYCTV